MALSQDEQRMLAEIERRLASDDPSLASCLTTFRRPGPATVLRSPRARIIGSLFTVLLVAMVSLMVYAMVPFRAQHISKRPPATTTASATTHTSISAATSNGPNRAPRSSSSVSAKAPTSQSAATRTAAATAAGETQPTKVKSAGQMLPEVSP
jgi:cytoskeletal protein RodZ